MPDEYGAGATDNQAQINGAFSFSSTTDAPAASQEEEAPKVPESTPEETDTTEAVSTVLAAETTAEGVAAPSEEAAATPSAVPNETDPKEPPELPAAAAPTPDIPALQTDIAALQEAVTTFQKEVQHLQELQQEWLAQQRILEDSVAVLQEAAKTLSEGEASAVQMRTTLQQTCHHVEHTTRYYYKVMEQIPQAADAAYTKVLAKHQQAYSDLLSKVGKYIADNTGTGSKSSLLPTIGIAVLQLILIYVMTR